MSDEHTQIATALRYSDAHQKLVVGTEVLRTGGGATLTAGECNAVLDRLTDLERALDRVRNEAPDYIKGLVHDVWGLVHDA